MFCTVYEENGKSRVINICQIVWFDANECIICLANKEEIKVDQESMLKILDTTIFMNKRIIINKRTTPKEI